ncbi:AraC family transcriptional regulator [Vibrio harveyi]|nr:AraC family transcriptional regulator [Vibrio harveyi]
MSNRCGFGSAAYFCDAFKRKYHLTPSQFRAQSKKTSDASLVSTRSNDVS